jgi:endonuclease/exonuclease/phosphatase family metal-dependent hydrolase
VEVERVELPRTRRSLMASDHLPLVAELQIRLP